MISNLLANYLEAGAIILFGIGFTMLLFHRNLFKKLSYRLKTLEESTSLK